MDIVEEYYDIPEDISEGLATGEYTRYGSVVRESSGQIKTFLDPVSLDDSGPDSYSAAAASGESSETETIESDEDNKRGLILAAAAVAAVAGAIGLGYYFWKRHRKAVIAEFKSALDAYTDAIQNDNMSVEIIDNLINSIEKLKKNKNYEKIKIELTPGEIETLVVEINKYTEKLAKANGVEFVDNDLSVLSASDKAEEEKDTFIYLEESLIDQKAVFESAV